MPFFKSTAEIIFFGSSSMIFFPYQSVPLHVFFARFSHSNDDVEGKGSGSRSNSRVVRCVVSNPKSCGVERLLLQVTDMPQMTEGRATWVVGVVGGWTGDLRFRARSLRTQIECEWARWPLGHGLWMLSFPTSPSDRGDFLWKMELRWDFVENFAMMQHIFQ